MCPQFFQATAAVASCSTDEAVLSKCFSNCVAVSHGTTSLSGPIVGQYCGRIIAVRLGRFRHCFISNCNVSYTISPVIIHGVAVKPFYRHHVVGIVCLMSCSHIHDCQRWQNIVRFRVINHAMFMLSSPTIWRRGHVHSLTTSLNHAYCQLMA